MTSIHVSRRSLFTLAGGAALLSALPSSPLGVVPAVAAAPAFVTQTGGVRVLCMGDSITYGVTGVWTPPDPPEYTPYGGYRGHLWLKLWPDYDIRPVGSTTENGKPTGPAQWGGHEAHGGWTIAQLRAQTASWMAAHQPDLVLLIVGMVDGAFSDWNMSLLPPGVPGGMIERTADLLAAINSDNPSRLTLVGTIPPTMFDPARPGQPARVWTGAWNGSCLPIAVQVARDAGARCRLVPVCSSLLDTDMVDAIHPGDSGHIKMADAWYQAITKPPAPLVMG